MFVIAWITLFIFGKAEESADGKRINDTVTKINKTYNDSWWTTKNI